MGIHTHFERFVRRFTFEPGGGLSIVRSLAEAMGGAVAIASTVGAGTTGTVTLPA